MTYKQLKEIDEVVSGILTKNPKLAGSKFEYAFNRFMEKNFVNLHKDYTAELLDIRIDNALVDKDTKAILRDNDPRSRGFLYGKPELKKLIKEERKLADEWDLKEVEVIPFLVKQEDLPELTESQKEVLKGALI